MPKSVRWLDHAWAQLNALPNQLRIEALEVSGRLLADAHPDGARVYTPVPGTFVLDTGRIMLYYRLVDDEVDVVRVEPSG